MKYKFLISITPVIFLSCASICRVQPITQRIYNKDVNFDTSEIPCYKVNDFKTAVVQTIQAIYSEEFEKQLADHIANKIGKGDHAKAWENLNARNITQKMREQINGEYVETYGGIKGLWLNWIYGNVAYDGTQSGPIRLNRIPLKKRSIAKISNTIAHETAHRIGLSHPHSKTDLNIAFKEPPYVIGTIVENIVKQQMQIQAAH